MLSLDDTVAAIATPPGQAGIGIVRLSGPRAAAIALRHFVPIHGTSAWQPKPRQMHLGHIVDSEGTAIDQVLLCLMPAPHSYTCQDVVELHAHGGPLPLRAILALCLAAGARLAEPGEFTLRAFINGRIDLAQAEAVLDVINAQTRAALQVVQQQLGGVLSEKVQSVRHSVAQALAYLQARTDFPEDDIPYQDILPTLQEALTSISDLLRQAGQGMIYRQGVRAAIVGRPNVGKSSLLNRLLKMERAIVTDIPGTTRDTLSETLDLQGIPLVLVDTAGIAHTAEPIEALGIARSQAAIAQADLVLLVVDASTAPTEADNAVADLVNGKPTILVSNKSDLIPLMDYSSFLPGVPRQIISALTGAGICELEQLITDLVLGRGIAASQETLISSARHQQALSGVHASLSSAIDALHAGGYEDLVTIDLAEALRLLGEITGETASDELLQTIFAAFCIGK